MALWSAAAVPHPELAEPRQSWRPAGGGGREPPMASQEAGDWFELQSTGAVPQGREHDPGECLTCRRPLVASCQQPTVDSKATMDRVIDSAAGAADWERLHDWSRGLFDDPQHLPTSFTYRGERVRGIPAEWSPTRKTRRVSSTITETVFQGTEPETGLELRIEVLRYLDHPALEWVAWLTNRGDQPTAVVEDLLAVDATFRGDAPVLYHGNGDFNSESGYSWRYSDLSHRESVDVAPQGGRPCDGAFPYFRLLFEGCGLTLAVGWPGQWRAHFRAHEGGVNVRAGQEQTRLRLLPTETIRTPRMTLVGWDGDESRAVNLWRRWYFQHVMPSHGGQRLKPLLEAMATGEGEEFTGATEANQIEFQREFAERGIDYDVWWIDAGWYPCSDPTGKRDWRITGTWTSDPERFPDGLNRVSKSAASHGAELLVWFEPERVHPGTWWYQSFPDWMLDRPREEFGVAQPPSPMQSSWLLDLSNDGCRSWVADYLSHLVTEFGLGIYRQDFNFPPLEHWRFHDAEDRDGMTENLYVQGYLELWDSLLERHPGLLIDSCASGGRRNDLETMRRSVPLHYTDYGYGIHPVKLDFQRTMFEWLPYFKETTLSWDVGDAVARGLPAKEEDAFAFHCALAPMLGVMVDIKRPEDYDFALVRKMVGVWRRAAELLQDSDYYPLTPPGRTGREWVGRQFCDYDERVGFIQVIRLSQSEESRIVVYPRRLSADAHYLMEEAESGQRLRVSGAALNSEGFTVELPPRSGSIWFYRQED